MACLKYYTSKSLNPAASIWRFYTNFRLSKIKKDKCFLHIFSGGEREIQRTMLELLNQLDGFDSKGDVKVVMATNRIETLDPALIRPGRIDRKIEFPLPDEKTKRRIFNIHTARMTLADNVNIDEYIMAKDDLSGADVKAICTEAGLLALRERRMKVTDEDFKKAKENVLYRKNEGTPEGLYL